MNPKRKPAPKLTRPVRLAVTLTEAERQAIDAARGDVPFAAWARGVLLNAKTKKE